MNRGDGENSSAAYRSSLRITFGRGTQEDAGRLAELRAQVGDEAVDRMLRTHELMRNPRRLDEAERDIVKQTMDPVLRDLRAAGAVVPEVRYEAWEDRGPEYVCAFIAPAGRTTGGQGVWVALDGSLASRSAQLAEQVQEWEVEQLWAAGQPATWPECPEHPASHPLEPAVTGEDTAVWRCPRSSRTICAIGDLDAGQPRAR